MMPKHLPLLALPLILIQELKTWFFLLVLILVNSWRDHFAWYSWLGLGAVLGGSLLFAGVRYWRFTYALTPQALTITSGLFIRKARHIPYANIQTLHRQQWFFLQPFGLESLSVETSGQDGKAGEATLFAVPLSVAEDIESRRHSPVPTAQAQPTRPYYRISPRDLNRYALTSLGFLPLLAVLFGAYGKFDDLLPDAWKQRAFSNLAHLAILAIVGLALFIVFLSILASYLNLVQRYYHFTLEENENTLIATRGLFKRTTVSVRRTRIQAARLRQSIIRQALHLTTVQALVASNASDDEKDNDLVLMPVVATAQTWTMMHPFLPWLPAMPPTFTPIPRSSHWYYIRNIVSGNGLIIGLALVGLGYFARQWLWLGTIVAGSWLLFVALQGRYAAKQAGVAIIDDHRLAIQTGSWWTRTQYVVRRENIQACAVTTSLWLVPKHRCHVTLNLRSGDSNQKVTVRYLDTTAARAIRDWFRPADTGQHF